MTIVRLRAALRAVVWLLAPPLAAQEAQSDPRAVQPERPTVATHAHTVAPGYVEIEAGVEADRASANARRYVAPVVTKIGLASHLQLNVSTPALLGGRDGPSGLGDAAIGVKWRVVDDDRLLGDFAILPMVKFPTGSASRGTGSGTTDVGVTVISSHDLGPVAMDLNVAYTRVGSAAGTPATDAALWTASFGAPVAGRLSWVAELYGIPTIDGSGARSVIALLTGPTFLVQRALSVDAGVITPMRGDLPNALYAGLVWNLGRLR